MRPRYKVILLTITVLTLLLIANRTAEAAAYDDNGNGNWSIAANWLPVGVPGAGDTVTIDSHNITLDGDVTVTSVVFGGNRNFDGSGNTLSATGAITLNAATQLTITGNTALHAGKTAGAFDMGADSSIIDGAGTFDLSIQASANSDLQEIDIDGTLTIGPSIAPCMPTFTANDSISVGYLTLTKTTSPNTTTFSMGANTLTVDNDVNIIPPGAGTMTLNTSSSTSHVFGNVNINPADTTTGRLNVGATSTLTVDGNISISGAGGTIAQLRMNAGDTSTLNVGGNWEANADAVFTSGIGTVNFDGGGISTLESGTTAPSDDDHDFYILNITNGTTVRVQTDDLEAATVNVTSGSLDMATNDLDLTVTGTLTTAASQNYYTGTGDQTINTLDNSGIVTCEGPGSNGSNLQITTMTNNAGSTFKYTKADAITSVKQGTYHHLTFGEAGGNSTYSLGGTVNANGSLTHDDGTLAVFGNTLNITGASDINSDVSISTGTINADGSWDGTGSTITFSDEGNLILSDTVTAVATTRTGAFGAIEYDGTAAQTVDVGITYHDLIIDNSGAGVATQEAGVDLDVDGNFTIFDADASFTADNANSLDVAGNFTNDGTFTHSNGTVTFNGTTSATFDAGSSNYNDIEINKTSGVDANDNVTFQNDAVTINGTLTITDGELIQEVALATGAVTLSDASSEWTNTTDNANVTLSGNVANAGTITFNAPTSDLIQITSSASPTRRNWQGAGTFTMEDVDVKDQSCSGAPPIPANITVTSGTNSGNNINWIFGTNTVSGTVYNAIGGGDVGAGVTVTVAIYDTSTGLISYYTDDTDGSGAYTITNNTIDTGDVIVAYLDDLLSLDEATAVTKANANGSTISNLDLYYDAVDIREEGGGIANSDLANLDSGTDNDIKYTVAGGNLTVSNNFALYINSGDTFTPVGDVTLDSANCQIVGTLNLNGAYTLEITTSGDLDIDGDLTLGNNSSVDIADATSVSGASTITLTGSSTIETGTVANSAFNMDVGASIEDGAGSFDLILRASANSDLQSIDIDGELTIGPSNNDTAAFRFAANQPISTGNLTFTNNGFFNNTPRLSMGSYDLNVDGNLELDFSANSVGTLDTGSNLTEVSGYVEITTADGATATLEIGDNSTLTVDGYLSASGPVGTHPTLDMGDGSVLNVGGNLTFDSQTSFSAGNGTVNFNGTALQTVTSDSANTYNIITVSNASAGGVKFADGFTTANLIDITPNSKLEFNAGDTYTITGAAGLNLNGQAAGTEITLLSSIPGNQFIFDVTGGAQAVSRVDVTDSNVAGAAGNDIVAYNSINSGGNDDGDVTPHWVFEDLSITTPITGTVTGRTPTIIGTAGAGDIVVIKGTVAFAPFQQVASTVADANGNYRVRQSDYTANLDTGANDIRADVGLGQSNVVNINNVVQTPTFNQVPTITSPVEGSFVNGNTPTLTGRGLAGEVLILTVNDQNGNLLLTNIANVLVDGTGNWTIFAADYTTSLPKGVNYLSVTAAGTASDIRSISLTDPFGIVFDSITNNPIRGATVTIYNNATGNPCVPGVEIAAANANPQTTGATGAYNFLCANGNYYIRITAPGYNYPSNRTSFPAGRTIVNGSRGEVFAVAGAVIEMDHPLDANRTLLRIKKEVNKKEVVIGDILTYTVTIENRNTFDVNNVFLEDLIPGGFKYIEDRAILDNRDIPDPTGNRPITFYIGTVSGGQTRVLKYQLIVGSGVALGDYKNKAVAKYADGTIISNRDSETVKVVLDPLFDLGTIVGKVFWDLNGNGIQDPPIHHSPVVTEDGIPNVNIVMEDGTIVTTDDYGRYHIPAIIPGRHVLRIDETTLPQNVVLTTDKVVIIDTTPGIMSKVNFGVAPVKTRQVPSGKTYTTDSSSADNSTSTVNIPTKAQTDQSANPQTESKGKETRLFFIAMGDSKLGYTDHSGHIEPIEDNDKFRDGFWSEGKLAYYLKGKIKGKYLITSSLDTEREKKELFRNLDPDKYYPVYGDTSTINYDATNTQGILYLLIEWDKSEAVWGNYETGFTDSEFAQFSRTLYGGKVHLETVSSTKFDEPFTKLIVFDALVQQRAAHNEFIGTGGSLFYLKHSNIIEGSEKIRIETRDKITGLVLSTKEMEEGLDYEIDYSNGRIIFWESVSYMIESNFLTSSQLLDGNPVYVVVDYEYETREEYDEDSVGARLQQSIGDYVRIGGTYVEEKQEDKDYKLEGADATIHLGDNITLSAEYAESKSEQSGSFISTDGGLTFTELTNLDEDEGKAYGIKGEAYLSDRLGLTSYYKKIDEEFSSTTISSQQGKEMFGVGMGLDLTERTRITISHDEQKLIDDGNQQTQLQVGAEETKTTTAQITHQMEKLRLTGEYRHKFESESLESNADRNENMIAAKADYKLTDKVEVSLEQQKTLRGTNNDQTSVGIHAQPNERLSLRGKQTVGTEGSATSVGTAFNVEEKTDIHANMSVVDSHRNGQTQSVVFGSEQKIDDELALTTDKTYSKSEDTLTEGNTVGLTKENNGKKLKGTYTKQQLQNMTENANTNIFGLSGDINDRWAMSGNFENGEVQNHDGTRTVRNASALGINYAKKDSEKGYIQLKTSSKLEFRKDDGTQEDKEQYLIYNAVEGKPSINTTLFAKVHLSQTDNISDNSIEAQYKEIVTGAAYRPVEFDRVNLLGKYTYLEDDSPEGQTDFSDIQAEKSHTLAGELAYDINYKWQFVEKLAYKLGEEKAEGFNFTKTQTWLMIHRLNYNFAEDWQLGTEYRCLAQEQAEDYKQGVLVEVSRQINEFVQMGTGYNFTDFNDDITHLDYTSQGPFIRLTATLYDRTPEEIQLAKERRLEENIKRWTFELVNGELAKPNSAIMQNLNHYYNTAEKLQAEGKIKEAKEIYERIQTAIDIMYNEAEEYIRERIELEKELEEYNQIALEYYQQGKLLEAKEIWEKIIKEAEPKPISFKL